MGGLVWFGVGRGKAFSRRGQNYFFFLQAGGSRKKSLHLFPAIMETEEPARFKV